MLRRYVLGSSALIAALMFAAVPALAADPVSVSGGSYTLTGSGADVWGTTDAFTYAYTQVTGDGTWTAEVVSQADTDPWAKAGVMVRQSLDPGSAEVFAAVTPETNGPQDAWRPSSGAQSNGSNVSKGANAPIWVQVTRKGTQWTLSYSTDGKTWTQYPQEPPAIDMGSGPVYVGVADLSHNTTKGGTDVFGSLSFAPSAAQMVPGGSVQTLASGSGGASLPKTGGNQVGMAIGGGLLLAGVALAMRRRRTTSQAE